MYIIIWTIWAIPTYRLYDSAINILLHEHVYTCTCIIFLVIDIKTEIEQSSLEYTNDVAHLSKEERSKSLNRIQEMFKKATENSDNKVQIAMQMYEMVSTLLSCMPTAL